MSGTCAGIVEILESNLRCAEAEGDHLAAERIRSNIGFFKSRVKVGNDNRRDSDAC